MTPLDTTMSNWDWVVYGIGCVIVLVGVGAAVIAIVKDKEDRNGLDKEIKAWWEDRHERGD